MEKFFHKNKLIGIMVRGFKPGVRAVTDEDAVLQALAIARPTGAAVKPHRHKQARRATTALQECLVVITGSVRVDLYGDSKKVVRRVTLRPGDLFITVSGGHGFTFLKKSTLFEIKNGPYRDDRVNITH